MKKRTLYGEDDGLLIPDDLGPWTENKFDLIRLYCDIFSSALKNTWTRVPHRNYPQKGSVYHACKQPSARTLALP
jgi:hypothetical protein